MRTVVKVTHLTIDDFIAWEDGQAEKHELVHGEVFAMVGARERHDDVVGNIVFALCQRLREPCRAYPHNRKVRVEAARSVYYPDVTVVCGKRQPDSTLALDPVLVVEVLSEGTAKFDRTTKRAHYATIPSVQYILLVDTDERRVELDRRDPDGGWTRETLTDEGSLDLPGLDVTLDLDDIHAG